MDFGGVGCLGNDRGVVGGFDWATFGDRKDTTIGSGSSSNPSKIGGVVVFSREIPS